MKGLRMKLRLGILAVVAVGCFGTPDIGGKYVIQSIDSTIIDGSYVLLMQSVPGDSSIFVISPRNSLPVIPGNFTLVEVGLLYSFQLAPLDSNFARGIYLRRPDVHYWIDERPAYQAENLRGLYLTGEEFVSSQPRTSRPGRSFTADTTK